MADEIMTTARISVMVEISAPGTYGPDWKMVDIIKQVEKEALLRLDNILNGNAKIIGAPTVRLLTHFPEPKK